MQTSTDRRSTFWLRTGAMNGMLVVALGAFGAHALRGVLDEAAAKTYQTAVFYHAVHSLVIIACSILIRLVRPERVHLAAYFFLAGIVLFSGSLYLLAGTELRWLGAVTPFGGVAFLAGWAMLAFSVPFNPSSPQRS